MMQLENQVVNSHESNAIYAEGQIFVFLNIFFQCGIKIKKSLIPILSTFLFWCPQRNNIQ